MPLTVDLNESLEENLKANALPVGGRRRRHRGGDEEEENTGRLASAKVVIIGLLKKAGAMGYDVATKGAQAAGYTGAAGLVFYVVEQSYRANLCDPLTMSLAKTMTMIAPVAGYAATCDSAAAAYTAAVTTTALALSPLVIKALKKVASIVVEDSTIETVGDAIVDAVRDPAAAASKALETRESAKRKNSMAPVMPSMPAREYRRGGRRKTTKKRTTKKKTARRALFAY
jgi:hypothetical protein